MMTRTKKTIFNIAAMVMLMIPMLFVIPSAHAQFNPDPNRGSDLGVDRNGNRGNLVEVLFSVIKGLLMIVFVVAVLMFVIAGLFFLTSNGGDRADLARDILTYAIIGLVVSVLGYAAVLFLSNILIGNNVNGGGGGVSVHIGT